MRAQECSFDSNRGPNMEQEKINKCLEDLVNPNPYVEDVKRLLKHGRTVEEIKEILIDPQGSFWALHRGEFPYKNMTEEEFQKTREEHNGKPA